MLILTQDRDRVFNLDTLKYIGIEYDYAEKTAEIIAFTQEGIGYTLGLYRNDLRAKDILKSIWKAYDSANIFEMPEE